MHGRIPQLGLLLLLLAAGSGCGAKQREPTVDLRPTVRNIRVLPEGADQERERGEPKPKLQLKPAEIIGALGQTKTQPMHWSPLFFLYPRVHLDGVTWLKDRTRIANFYALRGFFDARVVGSELTPTRRSPTLPGGEPEYVTITHTVAEGSPSVLRDIQVNLHAGGPEDEQEAADFGPWMTPELRDELDRLLAAKLPTETGARFDMDTVKDAERVIRRRLAGRAFARPVVSSVVDAFPEERAVDLRFDVWPGNPAVFGPVRISGLEKVRQRYIDRKVTVREGAPWDGATLNNTQQAIYNLRMFAMVTVDVDPAAEVTTRADGWEVVPVAVLLRERKPGTFSQGPGIGFETDRFDGHWKLKVEHLNLFKSLVRAKADLVTGYKVLGPNDHFHHVDLQTELSFPDIPARRFTTFGNFNVLLDVEKGYKYWSPDLAVGVSWAPLKGLKLTVSYSLAYFDLFPNDAVEALQASGDLTSTDTAFADGYFLSRLRQDVTLDLRDDPLAANRGALARFTIDEAGGPLQGEFRYLKLTGDLRGYLPLGTPRIVLAGRIWSSWIHTWGDQPEVPAAEAVYAGGDGSVRGWKSKYLGPRTQTTNCRQRDCIVPLGGRFGLTSSVELRGRVVGGLWLAGFADMGRVWSAASDIRSAGDIFSRDGIQVSLGGGVRYDTPIGRIRVGFAMHPKAWTDTEFLEPYYRKVSRDRIGRFLSPDALIHKTYDPLVPPTWVIHFGIGESF